MGAASLTHAFMYLILYTYIYIYIYIYIHTHIYISPCSADELQLWLIALPHFTDVTSGWSKWLQVDTYRLCATTMVGRNSHPSIHTYIYILYILYIYVYIAASTKYTDSFKQFLNHTPTKQSALQDDGILNMVSDAAFQHDVHQNSTAWKRCLVFL